MLIKEIMLILPFNKILIINSDPCTANLLNVTKEQSTCLTISKFNKQTVKYTENIFKKTERKHEAFHNGPNASTVTVSTACSVSYFVVGRKKMTTGTSS